MGNCIKILLIIFFAIGFAYAENSERNNRETLHCFKDEDYFLKKEYGDNYHSDENIIVRKITYGDGLESDFFWVVDTTPSVNITKNLLIRKKNGVVCNLLNIPAMSSNDFKLGLKGDLPLTVVASDTPANGLDKRTITFKLNRKIGTYSPFECRVANGKRSKKVNCSEFF